MTNKNVMFSVIPILMLFRITHCINTASYKWRLLKSLRSETHTPPPIIIGLTDVNPHRSHKNSLKK